MLILRRMQASRVVAVSFVSAGYQTCSAREVSFRPVDVYRGKLVVVVVLLLLLLMMRTRVGTGVGAIIKVIPCLVS